MKKLLFTGWIIVLLSACSSYDDMELGFAKSDIVGVWADSTLAQPKGKLVHLLTFSENGVFVSRSESYGIYDGQDVNTLSGWSESVGNYVVSEGKMFFISRQVSGWDSFSENAAVTTQKNDQEIFEDCSYVLNKDTLTLEYTTYPADAPVRTERKYIRIE